MPQAPPPGSAVPRPTAPVPAAPAGVVEDVRASLAALRAQETDTQVEGYRELESLLRETLRSAGEDA